MLSLALCDVRLICRAGKWLWGGFGSLWARYGLAVGLLRPLFDIASLSAMRALSDSGQTAWKVTIGSLPIDETTIAAHISCDESSNSRSDRCPIDTCGWLLIDLFVVIVQINAVHSRTAMNGIQLKPVSQCSLWLFDSLS